MKDYYKILGSSKDETIEQIKIKYRALAMKHHPDKNPGDSKSEELFKEISEAYSVLGDKKKKENYDLKFGYNPNNFYDSYANPFNGNPYRHEWDFNFTKKNRRTTVGTNIDIFITISLEDMAVGKTDRIKYKKTCKCSNCSGEGEFASSEAEKCSFCFGNGSTREKIDPPVFGQYYVDIPCSKCNGRGKTFHKCQICSGSGVEYKDTELDITIPPGILPGMSLKNMGHGNYTKGCMIPGDLILKFQEYTHNNFRRDGINILYDTNITFPESIFGKTIEFVNIRGKSVRLKIPPGSNSGSILRIKGGGIPEFQSSLSGDLMIIIQLDIPTNLSEEELDLVRKLETMPSFKSK